MNMLLAVACGGALGALGRHFVSGQVMRWAGSGFPWGTLTVNVLGCFGAGAACPRGDGPDQGIPRS